ncbi:hypothetical protein [Microbacterium rhizomatis]|uniref:Uncharacterized protein n=1 Tax=Microbacterium rhizomatis TaxID=1631477 RepID=A0A5J5IX34_9MICO|nr:hypothetical protein [Microbacterium rhizomatis]KAA9105055.1 hypothetical protein F6B43_18590 [Microbacterium rhizomatis]
MAESNRAALWVLRILSGIVLIATGAIHLYLVMNGTGGVLGIAFVLNAIAGFVLGIGMLVLRGVLLGLASVLSLLFLIATLGALLLALTVGLFGITERWDYTLVPQSVVVESLGIVVLAVTTTVVFRSRSTA